MTSTVGLSRTLALVFTDLADSTALKAERGDEFFGVLIERHRALVRQLASDCDGRIIDWAGDGCFLTFETPSSAVMFSLLLQRAPIDTPGLPTLRVAVHTGEVSERTLAGGDDAHPRIAGLAVDLAAREAIAEGRRARPDLSIDLMQNYLAVSRAEIDARRDAALREAGLQ